MRSCSYHDSRRIERCTECGIPLDLCLCSEVETATHERLTSIEWQVWRLVERELARARKLFPANVHMMIAAVEEVGEVANALLENHRGSRSDRDVLTEAVQMIAMGIRLAVEGDDSVNYRCPLHDLGESSLISNVGNS